MSVIFNKFIEAITEDFVMGCFGINDCHLPAFAKRRSL